LEDGEWEDGSWLEPSGGQGGGLRGGRGGGVIEEQGSCLADEIDGTGDDDQAGVMVACGKGKSVANGIGGGKL
jgi:hypothetical protein